MQPYLKVIAAPPSRAQTLEHYLSLVKPVPRVRTIGAQLEITELGLKWICDVEFTVSHGEIDDYTSLAISSTTAKDCPWLDVELDNLSEDSKLAIETECLKILGEPAEAVRA